MTIEEMKEHRVALNTTDLGITISDSRDPAVAGEELVYNLTVTTGSSVASLARVTDTLPRGVSYVRATADCVEEPSGILTCDLGVLLNREVREFGITVMINAEVPSSGDGPTTITNEASVKNLAGPAYASSSLFAFDHVWPDPDPTNNSASEDTLVMVPSP
jgi:uncharacterized repeat protein (TIGR01451 family)